MTKTSDRAYATGRRASDEISVGQRGQAHGRLVGQQIGMLDQFHDPGTSFPKQQSAARKAIARRPRQHNVLAVGVDKQVVRSVDRGRALREESGV